MLVYKFYGHKYSLAKPDSRKKHSSVIPQIGGMFAGDRSRKTVLVEHGFRLPSALDNRPLDFKEFQSLQNQTLYISATPAKQEIDWSKGRVGNNHCMCLGAWY